ncbi:MAG: hypothetical protein OMM_09335 [Candidatus Magnetoglobus multicellularis str. Araruama]|uniref:STAS domain-containing protein n=1 Tax=Candidatus Magnetoglobus multicellularis str. Araruama TaxID=890399 RepID=A0A1V1P4C6_9BACT|nr:MAG: hypothetical protein OMM_09335 [Candidatus Magnetoglobus multicellularis str. Araruama]
MINTSEKNGIKIIIPQNDLVGEESRLLISTLDSLAHKKYHLLKIDFSNVLEIDATGVAALLLFKKKIHCHIEIEFMNMEKKINALFSNIRLQTQSMEEK